MDMSEPTKRRRVRAYAPEFKARIRAECEQPGKSIAKGARAHGQNANMIHTWRRQARDAVARPVDTVGEFMAFACGQQPCSGYWPAEAAQADALRQMLLAKQRHSPSDSPE